MYITYNYLNTYNFKELKGVGSQYQKILTLYAVAKKNNLKYIHIPISIGHNYEKDETWDDKWDKFFNLKKVSDNNEIDIDDLDKEFVLDNYNLKNILEEKDPKKLYFFFHTLSIFEETPDYYFKDIQDDLINAYNESNKNRKLIYNKNKINIAIHIRVFNDYDNICENINSYITSDKTASHKYYYTCDMYIKLINDLKNEYPDSNIHIFSQEKYFDIKFKKIREIKDINIHFNDLDLFDTFHHLSKADVLVTGLSNFSIIAALYNKNKIIYLPFTSPPYLKSWNKYNS